MKFPFTHLHLPAVAVQNGLAVVYGLVVRPEEPPAPRPRHQQPVPGAEGPEPHPVWEPSRHEVYRLCHLQGSDLGGHQGSVELR